MLELAGFFSALLMGMSLGIFGGGGSLISIPAFVYLFKIEPTVATVYSLLVVSVTSFCGILKHVKKDKIHYKTAVTFAIPSFLTVFLMRKFLMPSIPAYIGIISGVTITKNLLIMTFFALVMIFAAVNMISKKTLIHEIKETSIFAIALNGALIGIISGSVGVGGGFLIIPSLVLIFGLPIKEAVGTSLLIVTINSCFGFLISMGNDLVVQWKLLIIYCALAIAGILIGTYLSRHTDEKKLRPAFGWFVLVVGAFIIIQQFFR